MNKLEMATVVLNYRAKHNLSLIEMAKLCKVSYPTMCNIENAKCAMSKMTCQKILVVINSKDPIEEKEN